MPADDQATRRRYLCPRVATRPDWSAVPWTDDFVDIASDAPPALRTRAQMAWSDDAFFVRTRFDEPDVWATVTQCNEPVFQDNAFELFLDPDCDGLNYYELQINALGTTCELGLQRPYRDGGVATACQVEGLTSEVRIAGPLNNPAVRNRGWEIELRLPWAGLVRFHPHGPAPPVEGDCWRLNLARVQWSHRVVDGRYQRVPPHGSSTELSDKAHWVWSPQGAVNMHLPERWGDVEFGSSMRA